MATMIGGDSITEYVTGNASEQLLGTMISANGWDQERDGRWCSATIIYFETTHRDGEKQGYVTATFSRTSNHITQILNVTYPVKESGFNDPKIAYTTIHYSEINVDDSDLKKEIQDN